MLIFPTKRPAALLTIPKRLHQVWLGPSKLPGRWKAYAKRLQALNPEWPYRLWTDADLPELFSRDTSGLSAHYGRCSNYGYQSDIVRLLALTQQGGVYLDTDCQPLKPLDALAELKQPNGYPAGCFLGQTFSPNPIVSVLVENAVIGSAAGHPFLLFLMQRMARELAGRTDKSLENGLIDVVETTGPAYLSHMLLDYRRHRESIDADVTVLPAEAFYPVVPSAAGIKDGLTAAEYPGSYLVHGWEGSWKRERAKH